MELHWLTFQGFSQPINHNKVHGKSSSADIKKRCQNKHKKWCHVKTNDVVGVEMQQQRMQQLMEQQQLKQQRQQKRSQKQKQQQLKQIQQQQMQMQH